MIKCYRDGCEAPTVGSIDHPYAPGGFVAHCAQHILWRPPDKTGWRCGACGHYVCADEAHYCAPLRTVDLYERGVVALERIAIAFEKDLRHKLGPWDGEIRKVTPEKWETMTPFERHWSRTD